METYYRGRRGIFHGGVMERNTSEVKIRVRCGTVKLVDVVFTG